MNKSVCGTLLLLLVAVGVMAAVTNAHAEIVIAGGNGGFETGGASFDNPGQSSAGGDAGYISTNGGNMPSGWQGGDGGSGPSSTPSPNWAWGVSSTGQLPDSNARHGYWHQPVQPIGPTSDGGSGAFEGNYFAWFYNRPGASGERFIATTVTGLTAGEQYTTSFLYNVALGPAAPGAPAGNPARDQVAIELLMDGSEIWHSGLYVSSSGNNDYTTPFHSMTSPVWTATGTTAALRIRTDLSISQDTDGVVMIDNVTVTAVPEPGTFALVSGLALCGLVAAGIRRRRR